MPIRYLDEWDREVILFDANGYKPEDAARMAGEIDMEVLKSGRGEDRKLRVLYGEGEAYYRRGIFCGPSISYNPKKRRWREQSIQFLWGLWEEIKCRYQML